VDAHADRDSLARMFFNQGERVVGVCVAALLSLGCRKDGPETAAPQAEPEAAPAPADGSNTYVSGKPGDEPAAPAGDVPTEDEPPSPTTAPGIAAKVDTIAAARALVDGVADSKLGPSERIVAPALVPDWPTREHVLVFVVFPLEASKSGINTFIVGVPFSVTVDLIEGTTAHKKLTRSAILEKLTLGRDAASVRHNLELAEQTLIEVLLEKRPVERSLMLLDGYREWFNHHLEIMTDLDKRLPTAVRWLRQPTADGHTAG
jgi:hypothetical protein